MDNQSDTPQNLINPEAMSQGQPQEQPQQPEPVLFQRRNPEPGLFRQKPVIEPSPYSDEQRQTTAFLGALAQGWTYDSNQPLSQLTAVTDEQLTSGKEDQLRTKISDADKAERVRMITRLQVEKLQQAADTVEGPSLKQLVDHEFNVRNGPVDHDALEKNGIAHAQAMSAEDPHQAAVIGHNPDFFESARKSQVRAALFNRKQDIHNEEFKKQGLPADISDIFVLPGTSYYAQTAAMPGVSKFTELLPGMNMSNIVDALEQYDVDNGDYSRALDAVWDRIKSHSGFLATNLAEAVTTFNHLRPYSNYADQMDANFQLGLDAASLVPFGAAVKVSKKPYNMLLSVGARSQAAKGAATAIIKDSQGLSDAAAGGLGHLTEPGSGAFEASLPSFVKPNTMDLVTPHVGIAGDVADHIRSFQIGTAEAIERMNRPTAPLEQEQLASKIVETVEKAGLEFKKDGLDVLDIHNVNPEPQWTTNAHKLADEHAKFMDELATKAHFTLNEKYSTRLELNAERPNKITRTGAIERTYNIKQQNRVQGEVQLRYTPHNKNIFIHWVGAQMDKVVQNNWRQVKPGEVFTPGHQFRMNQTTGVSEVLETEIGHRTPAGKVPMGPKNMRALMGQLAKEFPEAETISGLRTSGTRHEVGKGAAATKIPIRPQAAQPLPMMAEGHIPSSLKEAATPYEMTENELNMIQLHFHLGKKAGGGGYANQQVAELAAKRRGFDLRDVKIIESNGQHFIRVTHNVPETGVAFPALKAADMPSVNTITQWLKNPQHSIPSMMNDARLASTLERGNIEANIYRPLMNVIDKLNSKQIQRVTKILTLGQEETKWYNVEEFVVKYENQWKKPPTQKELAAYYAYKEIYDANDSLMNDYLYVDNARKGYVTASVSNPTTEFDLPRQNMRPVEKPEFSKTIVYDVENDVQSHPGTTIADTARHEELKTRYESGNYRVLELQEHVMRDGDPVKYVMVHKRSSTLGPLERRQRRYTPGGEAENRDKWLVKQSVRGTFKGTQSDYALNPLVHIGERTFSRASEWAERMEEARLAFNGGGKYHNTPMLARRAVVESSGVESWEKWEQMVNTGRIRADTPFETLWDRALPSDMDRLKADTFDWSPKDTSSASSYFLSNGEYHWQAPREKLLNSQKAATRVLDPMKSVGRAANNAMSTAAFADYNRKVIEEWARVADPFINETSIGYNHDPYHVFFHGDFNKALADKNSKLYGQLEGQRLIHKRFLNMRTEQMSLRELANRKLASFVDNPKGYKNDWMATTLYDMRSKNPVDAIQGFVFDSYLGFYEPGQFFVQSQTAIAAMMVHPVYGAQSAAMLLPMTHLLLNYSDNLLDMYAKNLKWVHGLPVDEFKAMVKTLRASGWMKVQGSMIQLDYLTNRIGGSTIGRGYKSLRQGGRYLFNLAEKFNRLTAYQIGWHVARKDNPEMHYSEAAFISKQRMLTDDLTMNMTFASKAGWQKGLPGIPTKFMAYQAHMLESILPKTFTGGNPRLTGAQKTRLGLGQLLLYGTGGAGLLGVTNYIMDGYEKATGQKITAEMHRKITKGFEDTLINSWSGGPGFWGDHKMAKNPGVLETDYSARIGVGAGIAQWFQKMASGDMASTLDVLGGPTGTEGSNILRAASRMAQYFRSEQITKLTSKDWELMSYDMFSSLKSAQRVTKAYVVWRSGYLTDPKTGAPFVKAGDLDHWANFLGIPLAKETEYWNSFKDEASHRTIVRELAQQLTYRRRQAFKAFSDEGVESKNGAEWERSVNTIMGLFRDDVLMTQEVVTESDRQLHYNQSEYETMLSNMEKSTGHRSREGAN